MFFLVCPYMTCCLLLFDISSSPLVCVSPCLCMCLFLSAVFCMCVHGCHSLTVQPVNGLYYHTIKSPEKTLPKNAPLKKAFSCVAWQQCACCVSCLSIFPSPLSSAGSCGNMTPDTPTGKTKIKRLSVLQAVALGYCPISQEDRDTDICTGNQDTLADV